MANYHAFTCFLRALAIKAASRKKLKTGQLYMLAHEIGDGARRATQKSWAKIKLIISQLEGIKCSLGAVCVELKAVYGVQKGGGAHTCTRKSSPEH
jgi:hypothetical protein